MLVALGSRIAACLTVAALALASLASQAAPTDASPRTLLPTIQVLEDPSGELAIDQVRDRPFKSGTGVFGFSASAFWLRLTVDLPAGAPHVWWLDTGNRTLQEIDLFAPDADGRLVHQSTGANRVFAERPLRFPDFVFPLELPAGRSVLYMRVRSTGYLSTGVHPVLWEPEGYRNKAQWELKGWVLYVGMGLALVLLNLVFFFAVRDALYLRYVLSVVGVVWAISSSEGGFGWIYETLWPNWPEFDQASCVASTLFAAVFAIQFVGHLTDMPRLRPRTWRAISAMLWMLVVVLGFQAVVTLFGFSVPAAVLQWLHVFGTIPYTAMMLVLITALGIMAKGGVRSARIAFIAYLPLLVAASWTSALVTAGHKISLLPALVCSAWELLVMAIALGDRFNQEKQARLQAQEALVDALQRSERELEAKVALRTAELEGEKARATGLLHNILPVNVAGELSATGHARTVRHESATILFTDFSGFTQAVSTMPADRMVAELNEIFAAFDDIADECGIEKIKTIGDAYMAAGGLPQPCADHAERCVRAGLRMVGYLERRNREAAFKWSLRVGIHSGPVIAGVVGKRKYAYDIWGDTVNIAARMESAGEPGRVNISAYTYDLVRDGFRCEYRGKVEAKGKGPVDMYFVVAPRLGESDAPAVAAVAAS